MKGSVKRLLFQLLHILSERASDTPGLHMLCLLGRIVANVALCRYVVAQLGANVVEVFFDLLFVGYFARVPRKAANAFA